MEGAHHPQDEGLGWTCAHAGGGGAAAKMPSAYGGGGGAAAAAQTTPAMWAERMTAKAGPHVVGRAIPAARAVCLRCYVAALVVCLAPWPVGPACSTAASSCCCDVS